MEVGFSPYSRFNTWLPCVARLDTEPVGDDLKRSGACEERRSVHAGSRSAQVTLGVACEAGPGRWGGAAL